MFTFVYTLSKEIVSNLCQMLVPLSRMYLYFSVSKCSHVQCVGVVYSTVLMVNDILSLYRKQTVKTLPS